MNKNNAVKIKLANLAFVLGIIFSIFCASPALAKKNRYIAVEKVTTKNSELDLFINEKSQSIDLARTQNIRVRIKAKDLYNSIDRTASFKISVFENTGTERKFISSQQLSIFKGFKRSRVLSISAGEFSSPTKILEFDIYDTAGNIINTYRTTITAQNLESQVTGSTGINIAEADCDGETFGECQIDYLLQRVQFEAKPQRQASTRVIKTNDGLYKITFPFPRNKFKFLGRKVRRKTKDNFGTGTGDGTGTGIADFGETINISTINVGNSLSESQFISYGPNGDLNFNDNLFLDLEGKLGVGVQPPQGWLHVRNGDGVYPSVKIGAGPLTTVPVDGAIEYDGSNLYFTVGSTRNILGSGGGGSSNGGTTTFNSTTQVFNQGDVTFNRTNVTNNDITEVYNQGDLLFNGTDITNTSVTEVYNQGNVTYNNTFITNNNVTQIFNQGNILYNQTTLDYFDTINNYYNSTNTYNNGTVNYNNGTVVNFTNGSYIQNVEVNGFNFFNENSYTQINGVLAIPGGTQYQVLTYINGIALWRDSSAVFNGVTSVNQTFNVDNGTYNIDNGTYNYNDTFVTVDNGTYNYNDTFVTVDNGTYIYNDTYVTVDNGTYIYNNTDVTVNNGTYNYNDTFVTVDNGTYNYNDTFVTVDNGVYNYNDTYITYTNGIELYENGKITYDNNTVITFKNGSYMQDAYLNGTTTIDGNLVIPGGTENYVLTSIGGLAVWRAPSGNGGTAVYNNGTTLYFNQDVSFVDNTHNYFNTSIYTTNNIEYHSNLDVTYVDITQNFYNGTTTYYNQSVLYKNGDITLDNTDITINNSSNLIIEGGNNGQVLTYVNGIALWRNSTGGNGSGSFIDNGTYNYYNLDITYVDNIHQYFNTDITYYNGTVNMYNQDINYVDNFHTYFNTTILEYNTYWTVYNGDFNFYNTTANYYNGDVNYFNQSITYVDNIHQYFNSDITYSDTYINFTNQTVLEFTNGSYLQNAYLNGTTTIDGTLNIPGGSNNQVLTYINGAAIWRNSNSNGGNFTYNNGTENYYNQDITYVDNIHQYFNSDITYYNGTVNMYNQDITYIDNFHTYFNTTILEYNTFWTVYNGDFNFYNTTANYYNGDVNYFNQSITYVDNIHQYFNSDITYSDTYMNFTNQTVLEFTNGSYLQNAVLNGTLTIPGGNLGDVLTSDAVGNATWQPTTGQWTDLGTLLHPADLSGAETIAIGGTTRATADILLSANGGATFNQQGSSEDFVVENADGQAFVINGSNGNVTIGTAGLIAESTFTLADTTQNVTFSMLPAGTTVGPRITASTLGLTVNGNSSLTVNVDGGSTELFVNGDTVSVGPNAGTATLNVDGSLALVGTGTQLVTAVGGITADASYVKIAGNAGAVVLTADPQITSSNTLQDGQILILKGTNDVNTVTVVHGNGVSLEAGVDFALGNKDILQLIYDTADSEWIEVTRSDK